MQVKEGELIVRAPLRLSPKSIDDFIASKSRWIQRTFEKARVRKRDFRCVAGEKIPCLGEDREISIVKESRSSVSLAKGLIKVRPDKANTAKSLINDFYRELTKKYVLEYIKKHKAILGDNRPSLCFKFYRSKWGSCSARNTLSFNAALAGASKEAIEYVVVHELIHLKSKSHSRKFWQEVGRVLPDYKTRKKWLKDNLSDFCDAFGRSATL